jgi:hypothetical protein
MTAELMTSPYPTTPPSNVPPEIQRVWRCQFCADGHHGSCPGAVRNARPGRRLVKCYCCAREPYCVDCKSAEDVDVETWSCREPLACALRVRERLEMSSQHRQLQECRADSIERARRIRRETEALRAGVPLDEVDSFDLPEEPRRKKPRRNPEPRPCGCGTDCGKTTRGGEFAPGHDMIRKSRLLKASRDSGDSEAQAELEQRGW